MPVPALPARSPRPPRDRTAHRRAALALTVAALLCLSACGTPAADSPDEAGPGAGPTPTLTPTTAAPGGADQDDADPDGADPDGADPAPTPGDDGGAPDAGATATPTASETPTASPTPTPTPLPPTEGVLRIGLPVDRPGLSTREGTSQPAGFDAETARAVAAFLGFSPEQITWVPLTSRSPAQALAAGTVDLAVGGVPLAAGESAQLDVAGPYLASSVDLLVLDASPITGPKDLAGAAVCAVAGSPTAAVLATELPADAEVLTQDIAAECAVALRSGRVDAVAGDQLLLAGLARAEANAGTRVLGAPFARAVYGVGLPEGSTLCADVTAALVAQRASGEWDRAIADLERSSGVGLDAELRRAAQPDPEACG